MPPIDDMSVTERSTLDLITIGRTSGKAHTATIWFVYEERPPRIYVQSGKDGQTDWYRNLLKTPAVTVQIGDRQFRGHARPIDDAAETVRVHGILQTEVLDGAHHELVRRRLRRWGRWCGSTSSSRPVGPAAVPVGPAEQARSGETHAAYERAALRAATGTAAGPTTASASAQTSASGARRARSPTGREARWRR